MRGTILLVRRNDSLSREPRCRLTRKKTSNGLPLRSLLERVVIAPVEESFDIEIIGEIAQMIEVGMGEGEKKGPILNERMGRSVKVVAGACNHRELTLPPIPV